jgi:hypothetical protein
MTLVLNGTTGVSAVDGSASTPAIQGNDSNTGMFFPAADTIAFAEGGTEVMRIDSSGNLGLGATPSAWASGDTVIQIKAGSGTGSFWGRNGTIRTITNGYFDGTDYRYTASSLGVSLYECSSGTHVWSTAASGTAGNTFTPTERARIDSSGNFLVGKTSTIGSARFVVEQDTAVANPMAVSNPRSSAATDYAILFYRNASLVGSIQTSLSATSYVTSSDYRLKHDIQPMTGALAKVAALKPVIYKWNIDDSESQGFIAHELQEVVPECVTGEKDAVDADGNPQYQGIDTSFLVATLTAAIQEQQTLITSLTARIAALEGAAS